MPDMSDGVMVSERLTSDGGAADEMRLHRNLHRLLPLVSANRFGRTGS